ncbi:MAG TPA: hypothetical protein VHI13_02935 [Candidatus Kapabacteria bacterium]|nr:hypothetical protein [Candidatus Kapabacteria bacterium]
MKNVLIGAFATTLVALALAACSNTPTGTTPTGTDTGYVKFNTNDKFTFNYYPHDNSDARVESAKQVKVWTVLKVDQSYNDRSGVTVIEEVTFNGTGTTATGQRDTFYFQSSKNGEVSQSDLLHAVVKRIPGGDQFLDSIPKNWIKLTNTKLDKDSTWQSMDDGTVTNTVAILTYPTTITISMLADHKGKQPVTVPNGSYTNSYHTDHSMLVRTSSTNPLLTSSRDSFNIAYDFSPRDGMVKQWLKSTTFFGSQQIPGFDMELVSVQRATTN